MKFNPAPRAQRSKANVFRALPVLIYLLLLSGTTTATADAHIPNPLALSEVIQKRLQAPDEAFYCQIELPRFYMLRQYLPAWLTARGIQRDIPELLDMIEASTFEGLKPADYHWDAIRALMPSSGSPKASDLSLDDAARLDLLLTDAFLLLGSHLTAGRINPESIDPEWFANRRQGDMPKLLEKALANGSVRDTLMQQLPHYPGYHQLKAVYRRYREAAQRGELPPIPAGGKLKRGDRDARIPILRAHLSAWVGEDRPVEGDPEIFDAGLESVLKDYQARHGLEADGQVGPRTRDALNVPIATRAWQVAANLERWRWLPENLGTRYILVNIADYHLDVFDNNATIMRMGVIVGKPYRHTPVFSGEMRYLVFNPSWHVPYSIAVRDKLPLIRKDPGFLRNQGIGVFTSRGKELQGVDPGEVDWRKVTAANFNFKLIQLPGPNNALGRVKFMFPNRFNVYLHDTPSRELFGKTTRNFSSGCVRLERPLELAELVLKGQDGWDRGRIDAVLATGKETTVNLDHPLPVHLLYWTVFVSADGKVCFREDIYGRDRRLEKALDQAASPSKG